MHCKAKYGLETNLVNIVDDVYRSCGVVQINLRSYHTTSGSIGIESHLKFG